MIKQGDIISYLSMCQEEETNLQRGMNFKLKGGKSVILMSTRSGAPYSDRVEEEGKILIMRDMISPKQKELMTPKNIIKKKKPLMAK